MCFWLCCIWTLICFFISALLGVIPLRQQHNKSWAVTWWGTVRSAQVSWEQTGGGNLSLCVCLCFLKEAELRAAVMVDVIDLWACSGIWKKKKRCICWFDTTRCSVWLFRPLQFRQDEAPSCCPAAPQAEWSLSSGSIDALFWRIHPIN